ncbi:GGDEF domain-containing protein [Dyella sp.]|jgi:diguanylate cyclase (GGDEF)-like protein|uniref:tetratricopeptide repeat-containing diguanylate cyclase n=1 Tax=Dyella sp. TaxID=1869338 RepID=UPI002D782D56|nr:GGDEF domain-containing protein [Dyella sp.]HET6432461.1 GGDEF domain-containing protein [Dyella sp.]
MSRAGARSLLALASLTACLLLGMQGPVLAFPDRTNEALTIKDPADFLDQIEKVRVSNHAEFSRRLAQIHREAPALSPALRWKLRYLDALEASLQGSYARADDVLQQVIDHADDPLLVTKASALLMHNLAIQRSYLKAFTIAHQLTAELPQIQDRPVRFQVLSYLSQMLNLAGQTDLAIQYAKMMEKSAPAGASLCTPRVALLAIRYSAKALHSSDNDLKQAIAICGEAKQPIVKAAAELILSTLLLEEKRPAQALALVDRITPQIRSNQYYPHILSAQVQRAQAYEQLGRDDDAKRTALAALAMAAPNDVDNFLAEADLLLYRIAKRDGDAASALNYYEHYVAQQKSAVDDAAAQAMAYQTVQQQVLTRKLETEELSKQNSILTLQQALDAKAAETSRLYITLLIILVAVIALWLVRSMRLQMRFKKLANHDGLTGILNHQRFMGEAERLLRLAEKKGFDLSLVSIDLDHFKQVNDSYGHAMGDEVLKQAVRICQLQLRASDLFGRLGGEEFGVLLQECSREQALEIAHCLRKAIGETPIERDGKTIWISASVGLACTSRSGFGLQHLCMDADAALYRAKRAGRNRVMTDAEDSEFALA